MIDSTVDMADEATEDNYNVVRLRIWARQWRAAHLAPKKYGKAAQKAATNLSVTVNQVKIGMTDREALEAYISMLNPPMIEG